MGCVWGGAAAATENIVDASVKRICGRLLRLHQLCQFVSRARLPPIRRREEAAVLQRRSVVSGCVLGGGRNSDVQQVTHCLEQRRVRKTSAFQWRRRLAVSELGRSGLGLLLLGVVVVRNVPVLWQVNVRIRIALAVKE